MLVLEDRLADVAAAAADFRFKVGVAGPVEATALGNVLVQAVSGGYLPDTAAGRRAPGGRGVGGAGGLRAE